MFKTVFKATAVMVSVAALGSFGCSGFEGGAGGAGQQGQPLVVQCEGLDEATCKVTSWCEFELPACEACIAPDCTCGLGKCVPAQPPPPPPPADPCEHFSEQECLDAAPFCEPVYAPCAGFRAPCAAADQDCQDDPPECGGFLVCQPAVVPPVDPCQGLSEQACNAAPGCLGIYGGMCPMCMPSESCPPCEVGFSECVIDQVCAPSFPEPIEPTEPISGGSSGGEGNGGSPAP